MSIVDEIRRDGAGNYRRAKQLILPVSNRVRRFVGENTQVAVPAGLIVSYHEAWDDVLALSSTIKPDMVYILKEELLHSKLGWLYRSAHSIGISRGGKNLEEVIEAGKAAIDQNILLTVFGEGTRNHSDRIGRSAPGIRELLQAFTEHYQQRVPEEGFAVYPVGIDRSQAGFLKQGVVRVGAPYLLTPGDDYQEILNAEKGVMHTIAQLSGKPYDRGHSEMNRRLRSLVRERSTSRNNAQ